MLPRESEVRALTDQDCTLCLGTGTVTRKGASLNTRSGVAVIDPQCDVSEPCPRCGGDGTEPESRLAA